MDNIFDIIDDWLSAGGAETVGDNVDSILDYFNAQGVDLTQYSTDEIKEALDSALNSDSHSNVSFMGSEDNADKIASLERDLRTANGNIDYYSKEISNFNEHTSNTYRSNCESALRQATKKAAEIAEKISDLRKN